MRERSAGVQEQMQKKGGRRGDSHDSPTLNIPEGTTLVQVVVGGLKSALHV